MKSHGDRSFYQVTESPPSTEALVDEPQPLSFKAPKKIRSKSSLLRGNGRDLIHMIESNVIGRESVFQGPFGPRRSIYVDHTASAQSLRCIEEFVRDNVLPYYSNTHTTGTWTSAQTTYYRHEAREIIRNAVGASEHDVVIFCGSGATGPIHKLVNALTSDRSKPPPVVFLGPFEHHSNILPWRDVGAKIITIPETENGELDVEILEERLKEIVNAGIKDRLLIGAFSVASNVTGMPTDDCAITILLHKFGALALWDYSAAAPHASILMNPIVTNYRTADEQGLAKKDALYFSGHKFVGGPQTPGVLIAKNALFGGSHCPNGAGGGTVFFVTDNSHRYLKNTEYREEGGTPAIVESIRLGLVFKLKETIGSQNIVSREALFVRKILNDWSKYPEIHVLGSNSHPRIPIISFKIEHIESGYYLHHNYVVVLLNDLFGIQARGGCACAGPYGESLLGINLQLAHDYETLLLDDSRLDRDHLRRRSEGSAYELFRPGFTRLSIPYYSSVQEVDFVSEAVQLVAKHGWKLLPLYTSNPETGEFHHHLNPTLQHRRWLSWATFNSEGIRCRERTRNNSEDYVNYSECLQQAQTIFNNAFNLCKRRTLPNQSLIFDSTVAHLKWFLLPSEALTLHSSIGSASGSTLIKSPKPFQVKKYEARKLSDISKYYPYSIPYQIMQASAWSSESKLENPNTNKRFCGSGDADITSWDSQSSNESDNELQTPGATVTGPSICFSGSVTTSDCQMTGESPQTQNKLTLVDLENNNSGQVPTDELQNIGVGVLSYANQIQNVSSTTVNSFSNYPVSNPSVDAQIFSPYAGAENSRILTTTNNVQQCFPYQNNYPQGGIPYPQTFNNQYLPQPPSMCQSATSTDGNIYYSESDRLSAQMNNLNVQLPQESVGYNPQIEQNMMYNATAPEAGQMLQSFPQQVPQFNGNASPDMHCGYCASSSPSPIYFQQQQQLPMSFQPQCSNFQQTLAASPPAYVTNQSPVPSFRSMNTSPGPGSPVFADEFVNLAMRRVTDEIANELKFEIREVITQVEQGIDPDGARERANSFNSRDKRLERFKKRARTLSGQVLNGNFKKSESEDSALIASFARTKTIDSIWNSADSTKSVEPTQSEAEVTPKGKAQKKLKGGNQWHCPPKNIIKPTLEALNDFPMIQNGDRLLVCLSGGKDSLSLLHTIKQIQYALAKKGVAFTFGAVTVDPGSTSYNPKPLIPYLEALGVPYFFEEQGIMPTAMEKGPEQISSICSFCSRLKRGRIYATARENSYNVLALGQHLDDLAESFFMSVFHNGLMRTMKACYTVKEGDLRVIRPFINVREKALRDFAESRGLPIIPENCPACFDAPTERHRVKQLLAQQEILFPKLYLSLRSAMHPLLAIDKTGMESTAARSGKKSSASAANPCDDTEEQFCG